MPIYECSLFQKPDASLPPEPVRFEGRDVTQEVVADTASKARYSWLRNLRESWPDVKFADIRVRRIKSAIHIFDGWQERLKTANAIIAVIAKYGRHFFSENSDRRELKENPFLSRFVVDAFNELWFVDKHSRKPILVRHSDWRHFSDGGTLRDIVLHLGKYITSDTPIDIRRFSASPQWCCDGDLWGYGEDMAKVTAEVAALIQASNQTKETAA